MLKTICMIQNSRPTIIAKLAKKNNIFKNIIGFCEVQNKKTEQSFKINSVNAEWCNIKVA
ncbi:hypothetical protein BpHYR1_036919 [Brachionus plicatilis]|uniref:Uncharacterized protein n=1 Tax=Brachionus plicatilis TaxID=10195 RepID=A0A3M7PM03_BRAPC|nr:hypothetical protein BpHYR1_036919 [Brachionus plicatilis]